MEFIKNQTGESWWNKEGLHKGTRLLEDLRIDGDDAVDFFTEFGEHFKTDLSNLDLRKFFNGEGFNPLEGVLNFIKGKKKLPLKSITIEHLNKVIESKQWFDP